MNRGVLIPNRGTKTEKPDGTILAIVPLAFYGVQYVEKGRIVSGVVVATPDEIHLDRNGAEFVSNQLPVTDNFKQQFIRALSSLEPATPEPEELASQPDVVDAVATSMAGNAAPAK